MRKSSRKRGVRKQVVRRRPGRSKSPTDHQLEISRSLEKHRQSLETNRLYQHVLQQGDSYYVGVHEVPDDGRLLPTEHIIGRLTLSLPGITGMFRRALERQRFPTKHVTEENMRRWVETVGPMVSVRLSRILLEELQAAVRHELWTHRRTLDVSDPEPTMDRVRKQTAGRDSDYRQRCVVGLSWMLDRGLLEMIPAAPALKALPYAARTSLNVREYWAVAIDSGDVPAINAVVKWLKGLVKLGNKERDWPVILRRFAATLGEVERLQQAVKAATNGNDSWAQYAESEIAQRLTRHHLEPDSLNSKTAMKLTTDLVAAEEAVPPTHLTDKWYRRRNVPPVL